MLYLLRLTIVLVLSAMPAAADELEYSVRSAMEQARKQAGNMPLPVNKHHDAGLKAAQETARLFNSPEFQENIRCEQQRLKEEVFSEHTPEPIEQETTTRSRLAENEKVYLFFSSSVPEKTIHNYLVSMEEVEEPNFALLMKGYVPGQRTDYLARITRQDQNCVDQLQLQKPVVCERLKIPIRIQPSLFDKFEITRVPTVVYEKNEEAWKITGDAGLDYLLKRINQEAKSPGLKGLITALQRGRDERH